MAALCPAGCGKKFISVDFAEKHADADHEGWRIPKAMGWRTPYGFVDYPHPVTYEQACADMKLMARQIKQQAEMSNAHETAHKAG